MQISDEITSLISSPPLRRSGFMTGSLAGGLAAAVVPTGQLLVQVVHVQNGVSPA